MARDIRANRGRPPITPENRPNLGEAPPKKKYADTGKTKRPNRGRDGGGDEHEGEDDGGRGCAAPPDTPDALAADAATGEGQHPADGAESLLNDTANQWPSKHRAPRGKTRQRLTQRVSAELRSGGDPDTILDELTRDLADAKNAVVVTLSRTAEPGRGALSPVAPRVLLLF